MEKEIGVPTPQIKISLKDTTELECEKCQGKLFGEGLFIRKVSRFVTGSPQDSLVPIGTFYCLSCHHVNAELMPSSLKEKD